MEPERIYFGEEKTKHGDSKINRLSSVIGNQAMNRAVEKQSVLTAVKPQPVVQRFWNEEFPRNDENMESVIEFVESLNRPAWNGNIKDEVFAQYSVGTIEVPYYDGEEDRIVGREVEGYRCAVCGKIMERGDMHIGHIMDWKDFLIVQGVINREEAKTAYNDLNNLRIECPTCNLSHKYELSRPSERIDFLNRVEDEVLSQDDDEGVLGDIWRSNDMRAGLLDAILNVRIFDLDYITDYLGNSTFTGLDLDVDTTNWLQDIVFGALERIISDISWEEVNSED